MSNTIINTSFQFPGQTNFYRGKVRDVYTIDNRLLVMIATDRISAFDVVMPRGIPCKGQVLNQIASRSMKDTTDIIPNWILDIPHPRVSIGQMCNPFKVEMVIRGYLSGHAWRMYKEGKRLLCGEPMPDGMRENDKFPQPIITPTTKADIGHDEDITRIDILQKGLVDEDDYIRMEKYTRELYHKGSTMAEKRGLILVDTKYEFGKYNGKIMLIDEVHTPDSSRYFYQNGYASRQHSCKAQKHLSKEFVRQWLINNGFQGKAGQKIPLLTSEFVKNVSKRYVELYEQFIGLKFKPTKKKNELGIINKNVRESLKKLR